MSTSRKPVSGHRTTDRKQSDGPRESTVGQSGHSPAGEGERERRESRILDAAVELLLRFGYRKTTIDEIAREAGVGKGTIYLHWRDKNELFRAVLWRASGQASQEMLSRAAADPDGGQFHRLFAHGMVALYANPLLARLMSGKTDIFRGLIETMDSAMIDQLVGNSHEFIARLQAAGLIRTDLPANVVTFLVGALKTGIISASEYTPAAQTPSTVELTDALADLMERWLRPIDAQGSSDEGRRLMKEWMDETMKVGRGNQTTEE